MIGSPWEKVLEVGSAVHGMIPDMLETFPSIKQYAAVDLSWEMASGAGSSYNGVPGVSILQGDAEDLMFKDERFDLVLCMGVLEYLEDYERALREFCRVLKPGGVLVLSVPLRYSFKSFSSYLIGTVLRVSGRKGLGARNCVPSQVHALLAANDLKPIESRRTNVDLYPFGKIWPRFIARLSHQLDRVGNTPLLTWLSSQYIVKARKRVRG